NVAKLPIVWNVAPNKITPDAIPSTTLCPKSARLQSLDRGVAKLVFIEARIQNHNIRVGVANCLLPRPVAGGGQSWKQRRCRRNFGGGGKKHAAIQAGHVGRL